MFPDLATITDFFANHFNSWITTQFQSNDFLVGFVFTGILGALAYLVRTWPIRFARTVYHTLTTELTFNSDDLHFDDINTFLLENVVWSSLQRKYVLKLKDRRQYASMADRKQLQAGYGSHIGFYRGLPAHITRELIKEGAAEHFKEQVKVTFYGRSKRKVQTFVDQVRAFVAELDRESGVSVWSNSSDYWNKLISLKPRPFETIYVPQHVKDTIVGHVTDFQHKEAWYLKRGIPYHTGIFLYGQPGCGKTSFIHALASYLRKNIYYLNLGSVFSDDTLMALMARDWNDSILVIEDIDSAGHDLDARIKGSWGQNSNAPQPPPGAPRLRIESSAAPDDEKSEQKQQRSPLSLSSVLNALDGLVTPHNLIVLATSNHPERLDPALMREGRFDIKLELPYMEWPEFLAMAKDFDHDLRIIEMIQPAYRPLPPVDARNLLIKHTTSQIVAQYATPFTVAA